MILWTTHIFYFRYHFYKIEIKLLRHDYNNYTIINLYNGDILLEKLILDNINYTITNLDNGDKLLKKITHINIIDVKNIKKSIILECLIDNKELNKLKYKLILEQIYKIINDGSKIIKNTKLNIKTIKKEDEGFYYLDTLGISVQGVDSNKCILEIINQCIENEIDLFMKIKLINDITVNINF
jgi:hypothetical protein